MGRSNWRLIHVDGIDYEWFLKNNEFFSTNRKIRIRQKELSTGQQVALCPYSWELEIRPQTIRETILFAIKNGWKASQKGLSPLQIQFENGHFTINAESK